MKSIRAVWEGVIVAETNDPIVVEGNYYFPAKAIQTEYLQPSETRTHCPWKGEAAYFSLKVGDKTLEDCAWTYPTPTEEASRIKNYYAFWKGVDIVKETEEERSQRIAIVTKQFSESLANDGDHRAIFDKVRTFLSNLGGDALFSTLPLDFVEELSFFNFQNSNNLCFHANHKGEINAINPTFEWALNHLPDFQGQTLAQFLDAFEIIDGPKHEEFFETLKSHGWVRIPKIRTKKDSQWTYYTLDVAITKHGDLESLQGVQGELVNITHEVELSQSLAAAEANRKSLLDGLKTGLFFFDSKGQVAPERSQILETILPNSKSYKSIHDFASRYSKVKAENVSTCLQLLWQDEDDGFFSDFSSTISMLPSKSVITVDGRQRDITFEYRPVYSMAEKLDKVIVLVSDVTEQLRNEREVRYQAERIKKISKAAANQEAFQGFYRESSAFFERADQQIKDTSDLSQLKRDLHTLKGSVGTYEFSAVAAQIHSLEDKIEDGELQSAPTEVSDHWQKIYAMWSDQICDILAVLGLNQGQDHVAIERSKLAKIEAYSESLQDQQLQNLVSSLFQYSPAEVFAKYVDYMEQLNKRFPEKSVRVNFSPESCELTYEEIQKLDGALIHMFRNGFDHGIEEQAIRLERGKPAQGVIHISTKRSSTDNSLTLTISDDGAGINGQKLAEKALRSGYWSQERFDQAQDKDRFQLIFAANLSAKDEVSDVSGRGVGMDAVKTFIEELGGRIELDSKTGKGTRFTITIPGGADRKLGKVA
ncbi:DUF427 domain-containing protein [Pseudobacteriovorax antillogorgiicola]|uniref:histidine kinase n=1 Tax=Pseudobacteriovorax antillogorgiicola TaxID=1513793 RepID=A0A1Y6CHK8_9BACT|nr:DUF427 domain-containing protein [Pseudobacteriovorax antillogorgiicola]TCS46967.1 Hpt domain-containing protein [Pseudobacteriovorax antillogorgiicola]SMF64639.1 Hpt domain-containing protein [Pseudobacteriovorax antillogorgiicola]